MNPSSPSLASRPNTSTAIQSAHAALQEKARENSYVVSALSKRIETSPERPLIKSAAHKRMQSLQSGTVRDLSNLIEANSNSLGSPTRSPERSPVKTGSPNTCRDIFFDDASSDKVPTRSGKSTPTNETPTLRPSLRRPPQSILGDNTPPQSATMLALQTMASKDSDHSTTDVANESNALVRTSPTFDAISHQILSLTSIATNLQKEMAQLSRRSKDNATDLLSLKEATNARDEDIRKSLRELLLNLSESGSRSSSNPYGGGAGLLLEGKTHSSASSNVGKPFTLPRIPSPRSFAASLDRESLATPSLYTPENTATIALLEKILREMGTTEGQDLLISRLSEVADRVKQEGLSTASKLDELLDYVKNNSSSNSKELLLRNGGGSGNSRPRNFSFEQPSQLELEFDSPRSGPVAPRVDALVHAGDISNRSVTATSNASEILNEDVIKAIRSVKDSVAQGGGLTAEVKALVRELRGEVLGMGRDLGRKLEQQLGADRDAPRDIGADKEELTRMVEEGFSELKEHMDQILRECQRQSSPPPAYRVDYQEIYNAMSSALNERSLGPEKQGLEKEDILDAVREAWENYKPEIEVQQFGLEREELLECVKEGILQYRPQDGTRDASGASREEVFEAVVEGLKHFSPPRLPTQDSLTRDEILDAVREVLGEFEFPSAPAADPQITRDQMVDAVREGLGGFEFPNSGTALSRDLAGSVVRNESFNSANSGFERKRTAEEPFAEEVVDRIQEVLEVMRQEFKAVSDEAKQNVAAHGRDTEQVLDATKDGFEKLRADIESYVDRAADVTGKDEILDSLQESFERLHESMAASIARLDKMAEKDELLYSMRENFDQLQEAMTSTIIHTANVSGTDKILDSLQERFDRLQEIMTSSVTRSPNVSNTDEILNSIHDGFSQIKNNMTSSMVDSGVDVSSKDEVIESIRDGFDRLQETITSSVVRSSDTPNKDDILDGMRDHFDRLQDTLTSSVARSGEMTNNDEMLASIRDELGHLEETLTSTIIHTADVTGKDAIIESMRDQFDQLQGILKSAVATAVQESGNDEIISRMHEGLDKLQENMTTTIIHAVSVTGNEKVLESMNEKFDDLHQTLKSSVVPSNNDSGKEEIIDQMRESLDQLQETMTSTIIHAVNITGNEKVLENMRQGFEKLQETLTTSMIPSGDATGKDGILTGIRDGFESLRGNLAELQETLTTTIVHTADVTGKDKILDSMQQGFEQLQETIKSSVVTSGGDNINKEEILNSIRDGFDRLQEGMASSLVRAEPSADKDEIADILRDGLDSLREDIQRPRDINGSNNSGNREILDALQDGLSSLRSDVEKIVNKPVDMTVNYEILDALRAGLEGVRTDIDRLRERDEDDRALATRDAGQVVPADSLKRNDIDNLEVLITQLRIKVEALESMSSSQPAPGSLSKEHLDGLETLVRDIHGSVTSTDRSRADDEDTVKREDVQAIETLLRNTKAKLDEIDTEQSLKKEHLEPVETLISSIRDS